jgi:hypothetical protein
MNEREQAGREHSMVERLKTSVSRAQLFKAAGAGLALAALPKIAAADGTVTYPGNGAPASLSFPYFPQVQGTYTTESILDILNAVITTRYIVADVVYFSLTHGPLPAPAMADFQAGLARFQYQIDFLASLGARPLTTTATVNLAASETPTLLSKIRVATGVITTAMFITATRELAELGQPTLAKWMAQLAAREAESGERSREASGNPISPSAFETDLFLYTRDGLDALRGLGLIAGSGPAAGYPGRDAILAAAGPWADRTIQRTPNNASSSVTISGLSDVDNLLAERT